MNSLKPFLYIFLAVSMPLQAQESPEAVSKLLLAKEQQLMDVIATGDTSLWKANLHDSCLIAVEDGTTQTKDEVIADLKPLPAAYKGIIKVIEPKVRIYNTTAVLSFIADEYLELYGQKLHTQYRQTDTWMKFSGEWKKVAAQLFEIPRNPSPVEVDTSALRELCGTYQLGNDLKCVITLEDGKLFAQKGNRKSNREKEELLAETESVFFRQADARKRVIFLKGPGRKVTRMVERRAGEDVSWARMK